MLRNRASISGGSARPRRQIPEFPQYLPLSSIGLYRFQGLGPNEDAALLSSPMAYCNVRPRTAKRRSWLQNAGFPRS